ncbi:MAG: hypothetical protein QM698_01275 [Micropepsaceae bacterium]
MANANKIPVFEVVSESYGFAFRNIGEIFWASALPFIVLAGAQFLVNRMVIDAQLAMLEGRDSAAFSMTIVAGGLANGLIQAALVGIVAAALHRMVLFGERAPRLRFGPVERKFILASVVFGLALIVPGLLLFLVTPPVPEPSGSVAGIMLLMLVICILSVFFMMVFPIIVAEGKIDTRRSLALMSGNWWRFVGVNIVAGMPVVILGIVIAAALQDAPFTPGAAQSLAELKSALIFQKETALAMAAMDFVLTVIITAVGVGVLSFSYKALNGQPLSATLDTPPPE